MVLGLSRDPGAGAGWGPEGDLMGVGEQPWQVALLATRPGTRGLFVERDQKLPYHICFSPTFASWLVQRPLPAAFTSAWGDSSQVPPAPPPASGSSRGALSPRGLRGREAAGHLPCQSAASQPQAGGRASAGFLCRLSRGPGRGWAGGCVFAGWVGRRPEVRARWRPASLGVLGAVSGGAGKGPESSPTFILLDRIWLVKTAQRLWEPDTERAGWGGEGAVGREAQVRGEAQGE